jgi:hypothetical protein
MQSTDTSICRADIPRDAADRWIFEQITQMCHARILSRLRSKHAAKTHKVEGRQKLPLLLSQTMLQCKGEISICRRSDASRVAKLLEQCQEFGDIFERLEESDGKQVSLQHLYDILSLARRFETQILATVLDHSRTMNSTLKEYLPRAIEKLGRYRVIATDLAKASRTKEHSLFRSITVRPIELPGLQLDKRSLTGSLQGFERVWSRNAGDITHGLLHQVREKANAKYQTRIHTCGTPWKVHAEVQILMFYEQRPRQTLPRVICSSKSACYLCSLFLETHGKFVVPRTHGRIYDRWTLPSDTAFDSETAKSLLPVLHRFNQAVEATIRKALNGELGRLAPPNESVIALYEPWSSHSTIVPRTSAIASTHARGEKSILFGIDPCDGYLPPDTKSLGRLQADSSSSTVTITLHSDSRTSSWYLEPGEQMSKELMQGETILVQTSAIHLQFTWSDDTATPTETSQIHVEQLSKSLVVADGAQMVEVSKLRCDREETLYLDRALGVGRIVFRSGEHRVCLSIHKIPTEAIP